MAGNEEEHRPKGDAEESKSSRKRLPAKEVWRLIFASYWTSLPYLIVFVAGLLLATWLITKLVF